MNYVSLFSGIGAFEKAFTNIGVDYNLLGFSEIDKWAITSYCSIHDIDKDLNLGDIRNIDLSKIRKPVDLLTYGFPCQDVSIAGKKKGINKDTRTGLLYEAGKVIKELQPKVCIAENVKNLISKKFIDDFNLYIDEMFDYGYYSFWQILNSKDFGVPQSRERVFLISIRRDVFYKVNKKVKNLKYKVFPNPINQEKLYLDYKILLENTVDSKYYLEKKDYPKVRGLGANYFFGGFIDNDRKIYPTITASYGKISGNSMKFIRNNKYSYLTPKEAWRLMGFNDFDFYKAKLALKEEYYKNGWRGDSQMYKQAGNSIVVNVLEHILYNLIDLGLLPVEKYRKPEIPLYSKNQLLYNLKKNKKKVI